MSENTCICCGEPIPEGMQVCPKCEKGGDIGMELVFDEESRTWGEAPEVYGAINCPTKEDYEYALNAIKSHKQLEDKHWNECRQIAHYDDELKTSDRLLGKAMSQCVDLDTEAWKHTAEKIDLKVLLGEIRPVLKRAYFADPDDTKLANVLYDKINELIGRE